MTSIVQAAPTWRGNAEETCSSSRQHHHATDADGVTHIPSASIGKPFLGPGTRVTHQGMSVLGECGASVVWAGEHGVRFHAGGRALTRSSRLA